MNNIIYFFEGINHFETPKKFATWLEALAKENGCSFTIRYIFCDDEYLLDINRKYLDHDYYTDIITFDLSESATRIDADIYISITRVNDNAKHESSSFADELIRVMAHGVFHLLGFGDKTEDEALIMRELEARAIKGMQ